MNIRKAAGYMGLDELADGVFGYTVEDGDSVYIPILWSENPEQGNVSRYLDSLPTDRRVVFPSVISGRLRGALERRGFVVETEWSDEIGEEVEVYARAASR